MEESWKTTCPLDKDQVAKAVRALKEYLTKTQDKEGGKVLLEGQSCIHLQVTLHTIPAIKAKSVFIKLPHVLYSDSEICLFSPDFDEEDSEKSEEYYRNILNKNGVTSISKVMPLKELRLDYRSYEARRRLVDMYDLFLCDYSISHRLPKLVGKYFYEKRKDPWCIDVTCKNLKSEIANCIGKTKWHMSGNGQSSIIVVAKMTFTVSQIVENIMACAVEVAKNAPRGWNNVCGLNIKTNLSIALPVYFNDKPEDVTDMDTNELKYLRECKLKRKQEKAMWNMVGVESQKPYRKFRAARVKPKVENEEKIEQND